MTWIEAPDRADAIGRDLVVGTTHERIAGVGRTHRDRAALEHAGDLLQSARLRMGRVHAKDLSFHAPHPTLARHQPRTG